MKIEERLGFAIRLHADTRIEERIRHILHSQHSYVSSVQQTTFVPLRMRPIAISIETKMSCSRGETADVQVAT